MNDLNLAALQAARQTGTSGSRSGRTCDADDAADFDRVMARVARQDAAAAQPCEASAKGDARRPADDPAPSPKAGATDDSDAAAACAAMNANAAVHAAAQLAAVVVTDNAAAGTAAPEERTADVDSPSGLKPFATSVPHAPPSGHKRPASSPADSAAARPAVQPVQTQTAPPPNAAQAAAPVAVNAAVADADRPAAAAPAGAAPEPAGEAVPPRFEPVPASAQPASRGESLAGPNPVASAFAPHAPQTHSIALARIATPVPDPAFGADFANRVVFLAGQRVRSAELALTPADLGPLAVTIELRGQEAHLFFGAAHAATRAAIEDALPRLREMFASSGLQLADAQIGDQGRRDFARPQRGPGEPMRAIGAVQVAPNQLRSTPAARPDRLIDVVV